jgi:hypothetical protein
MKELFKSLLVLIGTTIVSVIQFPIGFVYTLIYMIYMTATLKDWKALPKLVWRLIDGYCCALAYIIMETCIGLDMGWNVNGEIFEDIMAPNKEDTTFGEKGITVSSSIGKIESEGDINKIGKGFSKFLSFVFGQKQHAIDSWLMHNAKKELLKKYENVRSYKHINFI